MQRAFTLCLLVAALLVPYSTAHAIAGIEGTFEFAFDAPWRVEPSVDAGGQPTWGAIPIQLSIHDANIVLLDRGLRYRRIQKGNNGAVVYEPIELPGPQRLGAFCALTITDRDSGAVSQYSFSDLAEVERTLSAWRDTEPGTQPIEHEVCRLDQGERCDHLATITGSSDWFGLAWYPVPVGADPGSSVDLAIEMLVSRDPREECVAGDPAQSITLRNYVSVELGEEPLPRFGRGWVYGDLHYHSQGTDNEGEAGHNYRGVVRAMGALGLDFAFATEHASSSSQVTDADIGAKLSGLTLEIHPRETRTALRDMNDERFRVLLDYLHAPDGVNREAATRAFAGADPQLTRTVGTVPQVFLGGEVDVIPELDVPRVAYPFGNGRVFSIFNLCGGFNSKLPGACDPDLLLDDTPTGTLLRDIQGLNALDYARWHLVYLPRSSTDANAFVPSVTGPYGGAGRRLVDDHSNRSGVAPAIGRHGYAFLAHPLAGSGKGSNGPDLTPWSDFALHKAFAEHAILGLQLWNENSRHVYPLSDAERAGYERPDEPALLLGQQVPDESVREGFYTGRFELDARGFLDGLGEDIGEADGGSRYTIAHGTYTWDRMNLWGLDSIERARLDWLPHGEPRRVFMAGGSDAHGDLNYRREGYFLGDTRLTDTAIGRPRNLVYAGFPRGAYTTTATTTTGTLAGEYDATYSSDTTSTTTTTSSLYEYTGPVSSTLAPEDSSPAAPSNSYTQTQIVDAIAEGRFSVTDGPALRIVVDRNRNGQIDAEDTPMGGVVDLYGETTLPLLVEWKTTRDFGFLTSGIDIVVGVEGGGRTRLYAPYQHGARAEGLPSSEAVEGYFDFWQYERGADDYWRVDGQSLHVVTGYPIGSREGVAAIDLDLSALVADRGVDGERYFVRAVGHTGGQRALHYAFTNPIWAMQRNTSACPADAPRALDQDGDGLPDGCDPCPTSSADDPYSSCPASGGVSTYQVYEEGVSESGSSGSTYQGTYDLLTSPTTATFSYGTLTQ
jgi:hypothetical protein